MAQIEKIELNLLLSPCEKVLGAIDVIWLKSK